MPIKFPNQKNDVQYQLRLNEGFREKLKQRAAENGRTLNAEIIGILKEGIDAETRPHDTINSQAKAIELGLALAEKSESFRDGFLTVEQKLDTQLERLAAIEARQSSIERLLIKILSEK